jgi:L-aminopeptidase/D-esterase-like protein
MPSAFQIPGIKVAHYTDKENITGATIFIFDEPLLGAADKRGGAQTTRQFDSLLHPHITLGVDAIVLSGGSAFGLGATNGVVQFLKEQGKGFGIGNFRVPRVPTACIFDLTIGNPVPPSPEKLYESCFKAKDYITEDDMGSKGAGTGATVGKLYGIPHATKGGIGFAFSEKETKEGTKIKNVVFAVVNAFGNIVEEGKIIAGVRKKEGGFLDFVEEGIFHPPKYPQDYFSSTVLIVGFTEGKFSTPELQILAQCLNSSLASCVKPAHTPFDGDIAIAFSCNRKEANFFDVFGEFYKLTQKAVLAAIKKAEPLAGVSAFSSLQKHKY